ncbi:MmgE/PrpD family protein [bacterium]|nr:MAG: MmgE/PrpD family protein [bacterium]
MIRSLSPRATAPFTIAQAYASWGSALSFDDVPGDVVRDAHLRFLDSIGVALACFGEEFARAVVASLLAPGGRSTVIGSGVKFSEADAAFANGTFIHGLDFDDTHTTAIVHASACIVPTALGVGESVGASGQDVLTAAVLGWETVVRIGAAAAGRFHDRGFHASGVAGAFAAALVAGKLYGLNADQLTNALGIVGSQAAGIFEYLADGSWVKRIHPGWAAHCGIYAARMARAGFTGPKSVFEGRFGLYNTHVGEGNYDLDTAVAGLGSTWETPRISYKPYPCCHYNHAFLDCVANVQRDASLRTQDIARIICHISERQIPIVCEPVAAKLRPRTDYDAKFSLQFCVAAMLVHGRVDMMTFSEENLRSADILELAAKVEYRVDPASRFPATFPGRITVETVDGTTLEAAQDFNRGGPDLPIAAAEIEEKFRRNAALACSPEHVQKLLEAIERLDRLDDVRGLAPLLAVR